jgi:hypothetical protein
LGGSHPRGMNIYSYKGEECQVLNLYVIFKQTLYYSKKW